MKISKTRNKNQNFKSGIFSSNFEIKPYFLSKYEKHEKYLNRQKSDLETLLGEIKNCELAILTSAEKPIYKIIKKLLTKLKKNLNYLAEEENAELNYYENINSKKKTTLQNQMFIDYRNEKWKNNNFFSEKKINMYNLSSELFLLKTLNFKAENDIKLINNNITKLSNDYNYLNLCIKYVSIEEKENICIHQKYYPFINKLLKKQLDDIRNQFELKLSAKKENIQNIIQSKNKNYLINKNEGYIFKKEAPKEYHKSFSPNIMDNNNIYNIISIYNKIKKDKKKEKEKYGNYGDNIIIVDTESNYYNDINISDDKISKSNSLYSSEISSSINDIRISNNIDIKNIIKPHINLNINFNLNLDKISQFQEHIVYNSQRNKNNKDIDKDIDKENNIFNINYRRKEKRLSSIGPLPNFMVNLIQEKNNKISRNNENISYKIKSFDRHNSNSKEILSKDYLMTI